MIRNSRKEQKGRLHTKILLQNNFEYQELILWKIGVKDLIQKRSNPISKKTLITITMIQCTDIILQNLKDFYRTFMNRVFKNFVYITKRKIM